MAALDAKADLCHPLQMKKYNVCGLGNSIVDILIRIKDEDFASLGYEKGTMNLVDADVQAELVARFKDYEHFLASGGSVANSIVAIAQLGGKTAFTGCYSNDKYGQFYNSEFNDLKITLSNPPIKDAVTATCVSLITPDTERTMRTCLGVSSTLDKNHVSRQTIADSEWLFVEGYLFANPDNGQHAIREAIDLAKQSGCKVAITFSDSWVIDIFGQAIKQAVEKADLIFANETEACHFTGCETREAAFEALSKAAPSVVMTAGENGAYLSYNGIHEHLPAFECKPVDMTGAGDMFAGAFLYGITHGIDPIKAVRAACYLSSKVISQIGARLHTGTRQYWDEQIS